MKNFIIILIISISSASYVIGQGEFLDEYIDLPHVEGLKSSTTRRSEDGYNFPTRGTYRFLTIFVNIIYDSAFSSYNPNITNLYWPVNNIEGINSLDLSLYFNDIFDFSDINPRSGYFTRFISDCSFDSLILISDFTSIEINASRIVNGIPNSVIKFINEKGGLQTRYGYNSISDYDKVSGINKTANNKIDYIIFAIRNASDTLHGLSTGRGYGGVIPFEKLKLSDGQYYSAENGMLIGVGHYHLLHEPMILVHEFAHALLGGNAFHTSGGNHYGTSDINTFIGHQKGYGMFGGGLRSINGYERWRLNWQSPTNSPYRIASNGVNSEIDQVFTGTRTYYLRDFITSGDAIRIKLPYKDGIESSNQYIWLENHQIGNNQKIDVDVFQYSTFPGLTCIPKGAPGIYSYVQVGKDILESSSYNSQLVYPSNETDNLRMIHAEGNFNMDYYGTYMDCAGWGNRKTFEYKTPNALSGSNDQTEVMSYNTSNSTVQKFDDFSYMGSKLKEGTHYNKFPSGGDELDCFTNGQIMDISSNPAPINATTYYSKYYRPSPGTTYYEKKDNQRDTKKKYLSGLKIKMIESGTNDFGKIFKIEICWDDYDVKQNVYWAGDIVLKEQLNLLQGRVITLEQNMTVNQIEKDSVSNFFAKTTFFTCEENSALNMGEHSAIIIKDNSSFLMNGASTLTIQNGGLQIIDSGSSLIIKTGANVNLTNGAKILIKSGGYLCIELGAIINLQDYNSLIVLEEGAIHGLNPQFFSDTSCPDTITKIGPGSIVDYGQDIFLQNETINSNQYIGGKNIFIGNNVTIEKAIGDVTLNNGAEVVFDGKSITFDFGFECPLGCSIETIGH
jgi:hypothetical protein